MLIFLLGNKIVSAWKHLEMFRNAYEIITKNSKETKHACFQHIYENYYKQPRNINAFNTGPDHSSLWL